MSVTLTFHDSQYPAQVAAQLCQGLRVRRLPGKFLYDSPAQAQRWLIYHQAYSPSRTETALRALYRQAFQAALHILAPATLHYISLGCGGGTKDVLLLQQAMPRCAGMVFTPMDTSAALLMETMQHVQDTLPKVPSFPLVVDLEGEPDLLPFIELPETPDTRRLLACFGMLPNFDYRTFLPYLRRLMRPADLLLLSANLSPLPYPAAGPHILPQYDNLLARTWFTGLLDSLGFSSADIDLDIRAQRLRSAGQVWQIRAEARIRRPLQLTLYNASFDFAAGERLQLFCSTRFTPQAMPQILDEAGFVVLKTFLWNAQEEGIYLLSSLPPHREDPACPRGR